jgi:hypothetical protein
MIPREFISKWNLKAWTKLVLQSEYIERNAVVVRRRVKSNGENYVTGHRLKKRENCRTYTEWEWKENVWRSDIEASECENG